MGGMSSMGPGMGMSAEQVYNVPWRVRVPELAAGDRGPCALLVPVVGARGDRNLVCAPRACCRFMPRNASPWKLLTRPLRWDKSWWARTSCRSPFWPLPSGDTVAKIENQDGFLRAEKVEKVVDGEMKRRDNSLEQQLKQAKEHAKSGDSAGAIPLYRAVLDQKCLFPKRAKDAAKELKKLGVNDVGDILNSPDFASPVFDRSKKRHDRAHHAARIDGGESPPNMSKPGSCMPRRTAWIRPIPRRCGTWVNSIVITPATGPRRGRRLIKFWRCRPIHWLAPSPAWPG